MNDPRDLIIGAVAGFCVGLVFGAIALARSCDDVRSTVALRSVEATRPYLTVRDIRPCPRPVQ